MGWFANTRRRLRELLHCNLGRYHLRRGNLLKARAHFQRAVEDDFPSYVAHYSLGKIFLRQDRLGRAMEELRSAREIDPCRFARECDSDDCSAAEAARREVYVPQNHVAAESALNPPELEDGLRNDDLREAGAREPGARREDDCSLEPEDLPLGDFSSREEYNRFAILPPIAFLDPEQVDWDQLGRELTEGS